MEQDFTGRTPRNRARVVAALAVGVVGLGWAVAPSAWAHVGVGADSNQPGAHTVLGFSVPHGCDGSPTTEVAVKLPDGINAATPTRNPFYTVATVTEPLDPPAVDGHGNELTERVAEVVWTALEPLPDGQRDVLEVAVQLPADAAGTTLYFPVVQTCTDGESAWVEVPAEGQDPHDLALPAPGLAVVEGSDHGHGDDADAGAADGVGADAWSIGGLVAGLAGVAVGAAALARTRKRT